MRAFLKCLTFMMVAAMFLVGPSSVDARRIVPVCGRGEAALVGITAEQGQLAALQRARADAVECAAGVRVLGSTLVRDSTLVADFLKTFTKGYIVKETVLWQPLSSFQSDSKTPPVPLYRVEIQAEVMIPEKKTEPGFRLKAALNRSFFLSGEKAVITITATEQASPAVFNIRADDRVAMLYPSRSAGHAQILKAGQVFRFPAVDSGLELEMAPLDGHGADSEAFLVAAVAAREKPFDFGFYFAEGQLYTVPEFFAVYSTFAEEAADQILPYEVRKNQKH